MIPVVYWSGTGNTEAMAKAVAEGIANAGGEAELIEVADATADTVRAAEKIAFGCPAMGAEELEESYMRPFMDEVNSDLKGKHVLLFGSYEWADGEWMERWEDEVRGLGVASVDVLIVKGTPTEEDANDCMASGGVLCKA
ncbi:flavodoxin short chain [Peptoniphilus ivorii]|uniref:flavodoxin n=1 Tax=Aedoeadaptatus ivorii TaxID=54006 RepID=UPI0027886EB6|nr:flavodoxin [Peptoniphilus ivorii]MDQ0509106.1 flavodoxin short chain [Peptoniphilus ivorii]